MLRWATKRSTPSDYEATKRLVTLERQRLYSISHPKSTKTQVFLRTGQSTTAWATGFFPCHSICKVCPFATASQSIKDAFSNNAYKLNHRMCCSDANLIDRITCKNCNRRYVGESSRPLRRRIAEQLNNIKAKRTSSVTLHFLSCGLNNFSFTALERSPRQSQRRTKEANWIRRLHSAAPHGMNSLEDTSHDLDIIVLPHSYCADAVHALCRKAVAEKLISAKRRSPHLKKQFRARAA